MNLYFLGTGAGMPSGERNVTSIALRLSEERGTFWLFDCGEGTQHQILKSPLKPSKLEKIFVTHLHGDHTYGLPGLLASRSSQGGEDPLTLYGPPGIKQFVENILKLSQAHLSYPLEINEIDEGVIFNDEQFIVETLRLEHRIECFGYRIIEKDKPGKLHLDKLQRMGIPPGPIYGKIKQGQDVTLPDGRTAHAEDYVGQPLPGRITVIMGDTRVCDAAKKLSRDADILVHEATFSHELRELAYKYHHTTAAEAALTAKEANARTLIITHISSRYQGESAEKLLTESRQLFQQTHLAKDFWTYPITRKPL